jgi:hypothetical protein
MNKLFPVIHLVSYDQMCENIDTCLEQGVNQVFLINHITNFSDLLFYANQAKTSYPELSICLNFLDLTPKEALKLKTPFTCDALWIDRTLTIDDTIDKKHTGEIFSGLNFKYQKQFYGDDLKEVVELIKKTSTVACTSGAGTGEEAPLKKIENLKELLGDFPLALASGVSSANIELYLPYVQYFLVASSITDRNEIISKDKLKELLDKMK